MKIKVQRLVGCWMMFALLVATSVTGADLRLVEAAKSQDSEAVRRLVAQRVDVNVPQSDGATALHWAAYWDDLGTASLLIRAGASVNAANDFGVTPLVLACGGGTAALVEMLLTAGANPNAKTSTGETPLMKAARGGHVTAVNALLAHGADVTVREHSHGQTALMGAVAHARPDVTRALVAHGADVHARSFVRRVVVNLGGERSGGGARERNIAEVDQGGSTPLLFAARSGDLESARVLVAAGANVNDLAPDGTSALVMAAHSGHASLAAFLLEQGADPNSANAGYAALHAAVLRGHWFNRDTRNADPSAGAGLVKSLLAHGANPNARTMKGTPVRRFSLDFALQASWIGATPFWLAARFLEVDIMRVLVANGADPLVTSWDGTTALMAAAGSGWRRVTGGAFVRDRRDFPSYNYSPEVAAKVPADEERLALDAVTLLVDLGADVNGSNQAGDTALHAAASLGLDAVIELLARRGARLDARNRAGQTPLQLTAGTLSDTAEGGRGALESTAALLRRLGARN